MRQYSLLFLTLFSLSFCNPGFSQEEDQDKKEEGEDKENAEKKTLKVGNLALKASQQPGPLIGFGENVIDKGQIQVFLFGDDLIGKHKHFIDAIPSILYGINDRCSLFFNVPIAVEYKDKHGRTHGFEDVFLQLEYAYYLKEEKCHVDSATVVFNVSFPTGSSEKDPPTGLGATGCFIGTTYNHTAVDWFYFTSYGAMFSDTKHGTKIGNNFLYQCGFGKNIFNLPGWIFAWMVEIDGQYTEHNKIRGVKDPNTGGNVIYATPSLWLSSERIVIQLGAGYAIQQNLFGQQGRDQYLLAFNLGYTF